MGESRGVDEWSTRIVVEQQQQEIFGDEVHRPTVPSDPERRPSVIPAVLTLRGAPPYTATVRAYEQVLERIEQDLLSGLVDVGGRLPPERALSERYGVSRASVREAIKVLEAMGVIRTNVGSGPDAGAVVIADPAAPIGAALRWHLASRHLPVADLVATRVLIESWAVAAAADGRGEGLDEARELLQHMGDPDLDADGFLELDTRFHVLLARAAGNAVVTAIMQAMRVGVRAYVTAGVQRLDSWREMADRLHAEHTAILAAVDRGDGPAAAAAVSAHITGFYTATGVGT